MNDDTTESLGGTVDADEAVERESSRSGGSEADGAARAERMAAAQHRVRPSWWRDLDVRSKILTVVVLCAVVPAATVGFLTYRTAESLITQRVHSELRARLSEAGDQLEAAVRVRTAETERFAARLGAALEERPSEAGKAGVEASAELNVRALEESLSELIELSPRYRELAAFAGDGTVLARAGRGRGGRGRVGLRPGQQVTVGTDGREAQVLVQRPLMRAGESVGVLVAVASLDELWWQLRSEVVFHQGRLLLLDGEGVPLFDSAHPGGGAVGPIRSVGVAASLGAPEQSARAILEYRNEADLPVLAAVAPIGVRGVAAVVEISPDSIDAPLATLRRIMTVASLSALLLLTAFGRWLGSRLADPLDALTEAVERANEEELATEVTAISGGQLARLTSAVNRLMRQYAHSQERLKELSVTDELTGLYNRSYLNKALDRELAEGRRSRRTFSLVMLDLDRFRAFNDDLGQLVGDTFLRELGTILQADLRPTDVVARYGGEEFVVVLPNAGKGQAGAVAERIRQRLATRDISETGARVTVSAGVASYPDDGATRTELLVNAASAVDRAKRLGRNRVEICAAA